MVARRSDHWTVGRAHAKPIVCGVLATKVERLRLSSQVHHVIEYRRVDPSRLCGRNAVTHVFLVIAFSSGELSGCETKWLSEEVRIFRELGQHLADEPLLVVASSTRNLILRNFHQLITVARGYKVSCWKDFDVDDGQNTVIDVVVVDFACDDFFANVVDLGPDSFVRYS